MDFTKSNNATKLKKIQQRSVESSNKIVAIDIPLDQIDKNPKNDKIFSMEEIDHLANKISIFGFFGAINVCKKSDGRYEIFSGHRRYEAMKSLGKTTIPCIVEETPDQANAYKKELKLLISNTENRKLSPMDMARAIEYYEEILDEQGIKENFKVQASDFFNISPAQLYRFQCLLKLIPELQALANDPQFPYSALREAAILSKEGQMALYKQLTFFLSNESEDKDLKLTRPRIEQLISSLRENEEFQARPNLNNVKAKKPEEPIKESVIPRYYESENAPAPVIPNITEEDRTLYDITPLSDVKDDTEYEVLESEIDDVIGEYNTEKEVQEIGSPLISQINNLSGLIRSDFKISNPQLLQECIQELEYILMKLKEKSI